jgi:ribosome maturation factor RimP
MDIASRLEPTVAGLGYELVDCEWFGRGMLRVTIDGPQGITLEDCTLVSNQLTHFMTVEGIAYDRLEVSSPGLDRVLKTPKHFERFRGERAHLKLRVPLAGRRNFTGVLGALSEGAVELNVDGQSMCFELANIEKARLVPSI